MQDGGNHVFDWPVQRPRADVQLVAAFPVRTGPRFSNGNMPGKNIKKIFKKL